jgi:hypothetical protein
MMSLNELQDQISADEKVLTDSIVTDEKGRRTPPMAPLEVLVRYTVFLAIDEWIEYDFGMRTIMVYKGETERDRQERERLAAAGIFACYDEYDIAELAKFASSDLDPCLNMWSNNFEANDCTLKERGLGETREQVEALAKKFLAELM